MAALKEHLPSLGYLAGTHANTFTRQSGHSQTNSDYKLTALQDDFSTLHNQHPYSRAAHLQRRWQQLKERELMSRQHNRELLQHFDKAQDTLEELLARNAAMKMIRMAYERYMEDWQQAAQRERMEGNLKTCLKTEEVKSGSNQSQKIASCMQSSRMTRPQSALPCQLEGYSRVPSSFSSRPVIPHPHQFSSHPSHHHACRKQDKPGWDYADTLSSGAATAENMSGHGAPSALEQPPSDWGTAQGVGEEAERSTGLSPKSESGGGISRHLSQELDIKPVRLSSSSESGVDSTQVSRGKRRKREKRGRPQCSSSEKEEHSSKESSGTSSAVVVIPTATGAQSSDRDASQRGSGRRSTGPIVELAKTKTAACEKTKSKGGQIRSHRESSGEESGSQPSEIFKNPSAVNKSESCSDDSKSTAPEDAAADEAEEENSSSEQSAGEQEERHQKELGKLGAEDTEEEESRQQDEGGGSSDGEDVSGLETTPREEEETGAEEDMEELESEEGDEEAKQACESEDESDLSEDTSDERPEEEERKKRAVNPDEEEADEDDQTEEGTEEEEEQRSTKAREEEQTDSEDSVIAPHENRAKNLHTIPEEEEPAEDDEDASQAAQSSDDSNDLSDDIEELLAPRAQTQEDAKDQKAEDKPRVIHKDPENLLVLDCVKTRDHHSDSDEFDHFYD